MPLTAVAESTELKALVFFYEPWSLWSMDRLDRAAGAGQTKPLAFGAPDPFESYPTIHQIDPKSQANMHLKESVARMSDDGLGCTDLNSLSTLKELLGGPLPTTPPKDMTPHHLCAFTCTVLQRLVMSPRTPQALAHETFARILALHSDDRGIWAGGEFIGLCLTVAAGIGKYGYARAPHRTREFLRTPGGITGLAQEIVQSGDQTEVLQDALKDLTPQDWAQASPEDIHVLMEGYLFASMDGEVMTLSHNGTYAPYVAAILGNILAAYPSMLNFLKGTMSEDGMLSEPNVVQAFAPLVRDSSAFGAFVLRQFAKQSEKLETKNGGSAPEACEVTRALVKKWQRLSPEEKAGYRWTTLDEDMQEKLAYLKPTNRVKEMASAPSTSGEREGEGQGGGDTPTRRRDGSVMSSKAQEIPSCAVCGITEALGLRLLKCSKCKTEVRVHSRTFAHTHTHTHVRARTHTLPCPWSHTRTKRTAHKPHTHTHTHTQTHT